MLGSGAFAEGVASGDPGARAMTLWTRVGGVEQRGGVRLEVARDKGFRHVVAREKITTGPELAGSVKARVTGLKPYEEYFYRFETKRTESAVGRFRTAPPADSRQPLTFGFFSCQDYTHGFYNAHDVMAREDLDFVVCLGDYIYAETLPHARRRHGRPRRHDRRARATRPTSRGWPSRSPTTATSTGSTAATSRCASSTRRRR